MHFLQKLRSKCLLRDRQANERQNHASFWTDIICAFYKKQTVLVYAKFQTNVDNRTRTITKSSDKYITRYTANSFLYLKKWKKNF
uniref:Uncharacterized protein n=1 Tax=Romanomermis culicivorax TaxID=13658 RepID=A0A915K2E8_ROMCU